MCGMLLGGLHSRWWQWWLAFAAGVRLQKERLVCLGGNNSVLVEGAQLLAGQKKGKMMKGEGAMTFLAFDGGDWGNREKKKENGVSLSGFLSRGRGNVGVV